MSEPRKSGIVWRRVTPATVAPLRQPWIRLPRSPAVRRWLRQMYEALRGFGWTARRHYRGAIAALVMGALVGNLLFTLVTSPWPMGTTLLHIAAFPNCAAARAVGLAPAGRGEPGYYSRHDADNDGVACEPWPRR